MKKCFIYKWPIYILCHCDQNFRKLSQSNASFQLFAFALIKASLEENWIQFSPFNMNSEFILFGLDNCGLWFQRVNFLSLFVPQLLWCEIGQTNLWNWQVEWFLNFLQKLRLYKLLRSIIIEVIPKNKVTHKYSKTIKIRHFNGP